MVTYPTLFFGVLAHGVSLSSSFTKIHEFFSARPNICEK